MVPDRWRSLPGAIRPSWGFYGLGAIALCLSAVHLLTEGEGIGTSLETLILVALSATIFYTGYDLPDRTLSRAGCLRAFAYTVVFTFAFVMLATAIVLIWRLEHGHVNDGQFVVLFAGVLGAAVGSRVNIYAIEFEEAFERNQALTKLLTVNQRVLRHNLRNEVTIVLGYLDSARATDDPHLDDGGSDAEGTDGPGVLDDEAMTLVRRFDGTSTTSSKRVRSPAESSRSGRPTPSRRSISSAC